MRILSIVLVAAVTVLATGCTVSARQAAPTAALPIHPDTPVRLPTPTPAGADLAVQAGAPSLLPDLHNWGPAPELDSAEWLNSPPLQLADLRGRVVLVEFWTFGCINCQHVTPTLQHWYQQYSREGLVLVVSTRPSLPMRRTRPMSLRPSSAWELLGRSQSTVIGGPGVLTITASGRRCILSIRRATCVTSQSVKATMNARRL